MRINSANKLGSLILLLILALFAPAMVGFQYLKWYDSGHLFIGIMGSLWAISYSDMYLNDWLFILFPNILILIPRLLFVFALVGYNQDRSSLNLVYAFGLLLIAIEIGICFSMMIVNVFFGIEPGVLILLPAPSFEIRLFVPIPILLLVGGHQVWCAGNDRRMNKIRWRARRDLSSYEE